MVRLRLAVVVVAVVAGVGVTRVAGSQTGADLWVDQANEACSDSYSRAEASTPDTPWCSAVRGAAAATTGDTVHIRPGRYAGSVRVAASGTRFVGEGQDVIVDAGGASAAVKLASVTDVAVEGLTITGAGVQGVWASGVERVMLRRVSVTGNAGPGIQVLSSRAVTVAESRVWGNGGAGIFEGTGTTGGVYVGNEISDNGINGNPYNGDGIQLGGAGAYVARNTISGNGDPGPFEHGIYSAPAARDFLIEENVVRANAGSNVKAAGANGTIRYNRIENGRLGLVFSDNPAPVVAYYNLIFGTYQHAVFLTVGTTPAQARIWNNALVVTARNGSTGDASAVFVKAAALLDLRNNLVSYTNADNAGSAINVPDARQVASFTSDNNWLSSMQPHGRHLVWNGSRVNLVQWSRQTGQDEASAASAPPTIDADARVVSRNLGTDRGQPLGLGRDYAGTSVPSGSAPDIGAYESA